jgi:ribose transport system substrate-binding protein
MKLAGLASAARWMGAAAITSVVLAGCGNSGAPSDNTSTPPSGNTTSAAPGNKNLTIAVIPKGTTHVYWKTVEAGASEAAKELGVTINWKGPLKESSRDEQIQIVEQFVSEGVSGIVLAPLDDVALVRPVRAAAQKKIPVVIFDSALKGQVGKDFVSLVATDNRKGGEMAGEYLAKLLGGKGKVAMLRYQEGSASTMEREEGFLDAIKKNPGLTVILQNRYGGATADEAKTAALNNLDALKQADGIYCPNESTTFGMLLALRQNNLAGKKKFVGFDTSPQLIEGLKKGEIDGLIAQNPRKMGHDAVVACVQAIKGEKVTPRIDTGATLVTKANLNAPDVKKILQEP